MTNNRATFEESLQAAETSVAEENWKEAVVSFQKALAEFPDDPQALAGLGLALINTDQPGRALSHLHQAASLDPENPTYRERMGLALERLGRKQEAVEAYLEAAERYGRQRSPSLALTQWQAAARVDPNCVPAHVNLLKAYLAQRKTQAALQEYLALANIYHGQGQTVQAIRILQHALKLDPLNPQVQSLLDRLRRGEEAVPPETGPLELEVEEESQESQGSPIEIARQAAMADLAESIFDTTPPQTGPLVLKPLSKREVDSLVNKVLDAQTRGDADEAIGYYEQILQAGIIQPAVNFGLGLLYKQQLRFEDAITQFQQSVSESKYRLASHFALGECYRAMGRIDEALSHFIEVVKIVDLGTVDRSQADDLIQLYEELAHAYAAKGESEQAGEFLSSLIDFLDDKGWEDKVAQARERLDALTQNGPVLSLAEIFATPHAEQILQAISLAQEYQRRGLLYTAMDALNRAVSHAPTFLPLHLQMAEVLVGMEKTDEAVAKLLTIADVYRIRGNLSQATAMYDRALRLAPMNVAVRAKLIDLLISYGEIDRALEHYLAMGDTYYQMAQLDRARETYNEALRLAPRGDPKRNWAVRFLHQIGDIDMQRVNWKRAASVYERIIRLAPDDEKAHLTLIDLYYRLGKPAKAITELDNLFKLYRQMNKMSKIITILQEKIQEQPNDIGLHARMAQAYLDMGSDHVQEALQELDVLGDLQLQAGRRADAITTIRAILRLNPPNANAYRQLLDQLVKGTS